jgi:hypothetical protein
MLNSNHPDDARLSALASADADAVGDASLTGHVASCERCTVLVEDLGALRSHLAALPDLTPPRPLRLVPDAAAPPDRLGIWVRKVFGPVMAAGAALALVGMIGTVAPNWSNATAGAPQNLAAASDQQNAAERSSAQPAVGGVDSLSSDGGPREGAGGQVGAPDEAHGSAPEEAFGSDAERSPWPMVLFAGIALLIAAGLLRWILVPRAG